MTDKLRMALASLISVLAPTESAVAATVVVTLLDLVTGILASRKGGQPVTSYGLKRTIGKLMLYLGGILLGFVVGTYLTPGVPLLNWVTTMIGLTETKSIAENVNILYPNATLKALLDKVQQALSVNKQGPPA